MKRACRKCGTPVSYMRGSNGKTYLVEPEPIFVLLGKGTQAVVTMDGRIRRGKQVYRHEPNAVMAYVPHFAVCPYREDKTQESYRTERDKTVWARQLEKRLLNDSRTKAVMQPERETVHQLSLI